MARVPRWLRPRVVAAFLALQFVGNSALAAISWGFGLVWAVVLTWAAGLPWYAAAIMFIGLTLFGAGASALLLRRFLPARWLAAPVSAAQPANVAERSEAPAWASEVDASAGETLTFLLRALSVPLVTRGVACDVRAPRATFPARATLRVSGLLTDAHVHYPHPPHFGDDAEPVSAGTYQVTWYAADENGQWRELVSAAHEVTPGASTQPERASAPD